MELWRFVPEIGFTYSYEWATDLQRTITKEYRQAGRDRPRLEISYNFVLQPNDYGAAKLLTRTIGASEFLLPLWQEAHRVGNMAAGTTAIAKDTYDPFYFPMGSILVWESATKYEIVAVSSINPYSQINIYDGLAASYTAPLIVPLRKASFVQQLSAPREPAKRVVASARFRVIEGDDFSARTTGLYLSGTKYKTRCVVRDRALVSGSIRDQSYVEKKELDTEIGGVSVTQLRATPEDKSGLAWKAHGNQARWDLLYWIHSRKGRQKAFHVPSWNDDIKLASPIAADATTLSIYAAGASAQQFPFDLYIRKRDGSDLCFRVTGASDPSGGRETLLLEAPLGVAVQQWEIETFCFLRKMRFDSDRIELRNASNNTTYASAPVVEVPL